LERIYSIIDIGTSRVSTIICSVEHKSYNILGKGTCQCTGITKGFITEPNKVIDSINTAVEQAEAMAGASIHSAYLNLKPLHIEVINKRCLIDIDSGDRKVTSADVKKLKEQLRHIELNQDWQLIDIIPRQFILDNNEGIFDPVCMVGSRLAIDAYVICGYKNHINSIIKCLRSLDIELDGFIIEPLASAESVFGNSTNEKGVIVINIDGNMTDIASFSGEKLVFCKSLPVGGDNIPKDLSISLQIPISEAHRLKKQCNLALKDMVQEDKEFIVTDSNDPTVKKSVYKSWVAEIIEARMSEIFTLSKDLILDGDANMYDAAEILLTGRGINDLYGCIELAGNVFGLPVRYVSFDDPSNPEYTQCIIMAKFLSSCPSDLWPSSNVEFFAQSSNKKKKGFVDRVISFLERFL